MKNSIITAFVLLTFLTWSCSSEDNVVPSSAGQGNGNASASDWLIPADQVFDGGPGKDGIPSLSNPEWITPEQATYLEPSDLVLGVKVGEEVRAYPHLILDWHEIVNDEIENEKFAVTYCPLTGTGLGWDRMQGNRELSFGVSGLLYNSNLLPYDRETDSYWSQLRSDCVHGELIETVPPEFALIETTWATWKEMYPQTKVMSTNTGHSRSYGVYPYGAYKEREQLFFPVSNSDDQRLFQKEIVHGVVLQNGGARVFRKSAFAEKGFSLFTFKDGERSVVVVGSQQYDMFFSYEMATANLDNLQLETVNNELPLVLKDQLGNQYDVFGVVKEGPSVGERLRCIRSFNGFWFAWPAFFEPVEIQE